MFNMPIYEYECTNCGRITEALQKFSDKPLAVCEHCDGKLQKLISQSTFHLKGSGWYVTDYAKKSTASSAPSKVKKASSEATPAKPEKKKAKPSADA
jgi:putative FmdB family regulatory protein